MERPKGGAGCGPVSQASASVASHSSWALDGNGHGNASVAVTSEGRCGKPLRKCRWRCSERLYTVL